MKKLLMIALSVALGGCTSLPKLEDEARYHQVAANTNGNFLSLFNHKESSDRTPHWQCGLNSHLAGMATEMEEYFKSRPGKPRKILISIHGGLNSISANIDRVENHYEDAKQDGYYPIFIGWRSGAATTLNDRYFRVRNGVDRSKWNTIPSSPFYIASDLLRGVAAIPESFWDQGANFINGHRYRLSGFYEKDIQARLKDFEQPKVLYTGKGSDKSFGEQVTYAAIQVVPGILRLISTPLIEGVANQAWGIMQRRAKTLMYRQQDLTYEGVGQSFGNKIDDDDKQIGDVHQCEEQSPYFKNGKPNGIVAQLLRTIETQKNVEITLVGHSMGAIIANDIVSEFPGLNYEKIIHMAAADSLRNFMQKTLPYLASHKETKFYNLVLHPVNEDQEQSAFGAAPEGSLLIWLDYLLTNPETTLDRVAGRWENAKWAVPLFTSYQGQELSNVHLKLFGLRQTMEYLDTGEKVAEPIKHGDFGDKRFWRPEFYWQ